MSARIPTKKSISARSSKTVWVVPDPAGMWLKIRSSVAAIIFCAKHAAARTSMVKAKPPKSSSNAKPAKEKGESKFRLFLQKSNQQPSVGNVPAKDTFNPNPKHSRWIRSSQVISLPKSNSFNRPESLPVAGHFSFHLHDWEVFCHKLLQTDFSLFSLLFNF